MTFARAATASHASLVMARGIDRIGNHDVAEAEIVLGNCVADAITRVTDGRGGDAAVTNGEFNRIDSDVHGAQQLGQLARNRCLSNTWQAAENDQHGLGSLSRRWRTLGPESR